MTREAGRPSAGSRPMAQTAGKNTYEMAAQVRSWLAGAWRYRWHGVVAAWGVALAGWGLVALIPDRYIASSRVYVDTQSILRPLLAGLAMQPNVSQIVEMMSRTLISRPNLERVIEMAGVDKPATPQAQEKTIERLTRDLSIKGTGTQNLYTITYPDNDPEKAKRVVQSLLAIFEGGLGDKRKDSDLARNFIEEQLKVYAERLTAAENAVTAFKRKNLGLMPGQGENFYTRLTDMRTALNQARLELAESEQGREALRRRFAEEAPPSLIDESVIEVAQAGPEYTNPELDARIAALQQKLDALRVTYTERHPDIMTIEPALAALKEQRQRERDQKLREREQKQREARAKKPATVTRDLVQQQLTISMAEYDASVAALRERVREYERRLSELSAAANAIPQVEAQYTQLTRDYEVTKKNYDQLAARRESAQLTGDVQSNPSTMEFRVIDPPRVSTQPDWPNRPLLRSLVLLAALGFGVAFAFLLSRLRPTVDSERALREITGMPVFGSVTLGWNDEQKRHKRNSLLALGVCMLAFFGVYAALMVAPLADRIEHAGQVFRR